MLDVLVELGRGVDDQWPVAGAQDVQAAPAELGQAVEVGCQRTRVGGDEDAPVTENRVAGEARRAGHERQVVGRMAGRADHLQRTEAITLAQGHVDIAAGRRQRGPGESLADRRHGPGVIGMVVRQRYPPQAAALLDLGDHRAEVLIERGTRIDEPRRFCPHDPGVGAGKRERTRIVGLHADDLVGCEHDPGHCLNCQPWLQPPATVRLRQATLRLRTAILPLRPATWRPPARPTIPATASGGA